MATKQQARPAVQQQKQPAAPAAQSHAMVRKPETTALADRAPDYLTLPPNTPRPGFEEMEQADIIMPRLAIAQSNSPQATRASEKYIDGLREAMYFNTITKKIYGETIRVVPLMFFTSRILFGEKMGDPLLCQALDGKNGTPLDEEKLQKLYSLVTGGPCLNCPLKEFGTSKKSGSKAPACTKLYNYAVLVADEEGVVHPEDLAVFTMKSSGANDAMGWNTLMKLRVGTPMYAGLYELFSMPATNGQNSWHVPKIQNAGWISKQSAEAARAAHEAISELRSQGKLRHDVSDLGGPGSDANDAPPF